MYILTIASLISATEQKRKASVYHSETVLRSAINYSQKQMAAVVSVLRPVSDLCASSNKVKHSYNDREEDKLHLGQMPQTFPVHLLQTNMQHNPFSTENIQQKQMTRSMASTRQKYCKTFIFNKKRGGWWGGVLIS